MSKYIPIKTILLIPSNLKESVSQQIVVTWHQRDEEKDSKVYAYNFRFLSGFKSRLTYGIYLRRY